MTTIKYFNKIKFNWSHANQVNLLFRNCNTYQKKNYYLDLETGG